MKLKDSRHISVSLVGKGLTLLTRCTQGVITESKSHIADIHKQLQLCNPRLGSDVISPQDSHTSTHYEADIHQLHQSLASGVTRLSMQNLMTTIILI